MTKFNATEYKNNYTKENYDRINLQVPKGNKEKIKAYCSAKGYKSLNSYINDLIDKDMNT